jgi:spore maturation protein CgeB
MEGAATTRMKPHVAFFGSSLVSAYWNGAATYYRGIIRALAARGYHVTFYEPDAFGRQAHRDIPDPPWAEVVVYSGSEPDDVFRMLERARSCDILVKASGVGVFDELLEAAIPSYAPATAQTIFWDVDAPATLDRVSRNPADAWRDHLPRYDWVLTYGGGAPVVERYAALGAKRCVPIYNALDPETHFAVPAHPRFASDLTLLANRLPDREERVEEFFVKPAAALPGSRFLLGGNGWDDKQLPANVRRLGHVYTRDHNALNSSAKMVLNVARNSMMESGFSPATRIFEAAGAASCIVTDAWRGIEEFLEPGAEILVANSGGEVREHVESCTPQKAKQVGENARRRVLAQHTYAHRAQQLDLLFTGSSTNWELGASLRSEPLPRQEASQR